MFWEQCVLKYYKSKVFSVTLYTLLQPFPVVWSPAGPVLGVSVGPDPLIQSKLSSAPCTQTHTLSSKEQPYVDRADDAKNNVKSAESVL